MKRGLGKEAEVNKLFLMMFSLVVIILSAYLIVAEHDTGKGNQEGAATPAIDVAVEGISINTTEITTATHFNVSIYVENDDAVNITQINFTADGNLTMHNITYTLRGGADANFTNDSTNSRFSYGLNGSHIINASENASFDINLTAHIPGTYNISIVTLNGSYSNGTNVSSTTTFNITVNDTTAPYHINLDSPSASINTTDAVVIKTNVTNLAFTVSVRDFGAANTTNFTIYHPNGSIMNASQVGGANPSINFSPLSWAGDAGNLSYTINISSNDSLDNTNNTISINVTLDTTPPNVMFTGQEPSDGSSSTTGSIFMNVTASDTNEAFIIYELHNATALVNRTSFSNANRSFTFAGLVADAYKFNVSVNDSAGNVNVTNTITYTVEAAAAAAASTTSSGGGGSQAAVTWSSSIKEDNAELSTKGPITKTLGTKSRVLVKIGGEQHHVGIVSGGITANTVKIEVASEPQVATLQVGDTRKFDVTDDGFYDISVKLVSINGANADLTLLSIKEKVTEVAESDSVKAEEKAEEVREGDLPQLSGSNLTWLYWLIGIVLVVIIGYFIWKKMKN